MELFLLLSPKSFPFPLENCTVLCVLSSRVDLVLCHLGDQVSVLLSMRGFLEFLTVFVLLSTLASVPHCNDYCRFSRKVSTLFLCGLAAHSLLWSHVSLNQLVKLYKETCLALWVRLNIYWLIRGQLLALLWLIFQPINIYLGVLSFFSVMFCYFLSGGMAYGSLYIWSKINWYVVWGGWCTCCETICLLLCHKPLQKLMAQNNSWLLLMIWGGVL